MARRKSARWRAAKARKAQARRTAGPAPDNLLDTGIAGRAAARPAQIELIEDGKREEATDISPPGWMWFKRMGAPVGETVHLLEVSPALQPLTVGEGSLCGAIEGRDLGYPWAEREPGDRYCLECVKAGFHAERSRWFAHA